MALVLCVGMVPAQALAEQATSQVVEGTYAFTSTRDNNRQQEDSFTFREGCFMRSSFLGCSHLAELSAQASLASASCFVDQNGSPAYDTDRNVSGLFQAMGFKDVEANSYARANTLPSSIGAVVGRRSLAENDKTYTLLALAVRGVGYQREWVGNVSVGEGNIHQGFKDARDEVLRFVRSYVQEHEITGSLKVWVSGHGRGGAVANLVAGFFAGGGTPYLGDAVSITPEDVYCYTFAAPAVIKAGVSKAEELAVSAARGSDYALDTPGDAYQPVVDGALDPCDANVYGGVRNLVYAYDVVPLALPASWGFLRYGADLAPDYGLAGMDNMATELAGLNQTAY